jgi:RNA polymerase sigma-70 factor (ECF subfamily)
MELAFLTAIQALPGRQRAVLILRDVLGWTGPEVAELLDTTVAAANSALQRARATIERELPALSPAPAGASERELLERYVDAWERADVDALVALLREDAVLRMPPADAVRGSVEIVRFFAEVCAGGVLGRIRLAPTRANGRPALAMYDGDEPHGVLVLETDGHAIAAFDAFIEPALVARFATGA